MARKILKITAIVVVLLLAIAISFPFIFKGKIISAVKTAINENLNAKVDFKDVDLSLFKQFPRVSLQLEGLSVLGSGAFATDTLAAANSLDVAVDIMSIIRGSNMNVYNVSLIQPRIYAIRAKDGTVNWDIVKPDTTTTTSEESKPFNLKLQRYLIENGYVFYKDEQMNLQTEIFDLTHEGSGDFTQDVFTLSTKTAAQQLNVSYGGIPYLSKVNTAIDLDLNIDNKTSRYSFKTDKIKMNELRLQADGFVEMKPDDSYNLDIKFKAPSTDFKHILSFIPQIYANNFNSIKTSGSAVFDGFVKGMYSEKQMPAYALNLDVKNGFFQYADLPKPVKNINLKVNVQNPDGITDHTVVDIPQGHIEFDNDPLDFRLLVKQPVSDMYIDAFARGKLNLGKLGQFIKFEKGTALTGLVNCDLAVKGSVNAIQKQQYNNFTANGTLQVNGLNYQSKEYPSGVAINSMLMTFNPKNVTVENLSGKYLSSSFSGNGYINNLLPYMLKNLPLNAAFNVKADYVNLDEFMSTGADTTATKFTGPFIVPGNLDVTLVAQAGKVRYDNLDITNLEGALKVADETVTMKNVKGNTMDGSMVINGYYSTKLDKKKPDISMTYDIKGFNVQKTFYAFNSFQKLMPIGKFLAGTLSSKMSLKGKLGENMVPEINTLSGSGNMFLLEGALSKFAPLEKLSQTLNITALQNISMKDIGSSFEFTDGKVLVKPFKLKVKGIDMEVGGLHGIDQSMNYTINMQVPREMMGTQGNNLVNNLVLQANNKGVPVKVGEVIPLKVTMTGTMTQPAIKTDLKQTGTTLVQDMKQQVTQFVQNKVDSAKQTVRDSVRSAKNQAIQAAKDELAKKLSGQNDSTQQQTNAKQKLEQTGRGLLKDLFKKKE